MGSFDNMESYPMLNPLSAMVRPIVEETITSGEYISVPNFNFLNIYIWNLNNYVATSVIFEEIMQ